ncbi:SpaH/EbpB family LPXTG-anchored major pilin [Leucobacter sp. NPDC058333]|uniref:SpaH/EbpB family LPXTG-anchored major pilin n=1 Tax=Leucobacter sp. NPDC058333 TaxID=3346450 RepID=UPI00364CF51F
MKHKTSRGARAIALLGTAAIAAGSIGLIATPAFAAPGEGGTGTLTVHKLEQPDTDFGPANGTELDLSGAGAVGLEAGFTVCSIDGIDLANSAEWSRLSNISASINGSGDVVVNEGGNTLTVTCAAEQTTTLPAGATTFDLAADKAYVVYESTPAENAISVAQPAVVTVPYPGSGAAGEAAWNYNPHIYPKNIVVGSGATKDGKIVGDKVTFDINVPIKPLSQGETYTELRINDQLSDSLQFTGGTVVLQNSAGGDVALVPADYTLSTPSGNGGDEVILNFTASGLAKIQANIGGNIVFTINADAIGTGSTANEAKITLNGKTTDKGPEVPNPSEFFGGAYIIKQADNKGAGANVPLAGASFSIYTADAAATTCPATPDAAATEVFADQVSGADGNTPDVVLAAGKYCVYETGVPAGYKGLNGGLVLEVTGEGSNVTVVNTQIGADEGDLPALPLTGAAGSFLILGGGVVLLLAGIVLVVARRRKQEEELEEV